MKHQIPLWTRIHYIIVRSLAKNSFFSSHNQKPQRVRKHKESVSYCTIEAPPNLFFSIQRLFFTPTPHTDAIRFIQFASRRAHHSSSAITYRLIVNPWRQSPLVALAQAKPVLNVIVQMIIAPEASAHTYQTSF